MNNGNKEGPKKCEDLHLAVDADKMGEPKEFEDIIENLGSFGHWQRVIFFIICLADVFGCFSIMVTVFSGSTPSWSCAKLTAGEESYSPAELGLTNDTDQLCEYSNYTCTEFIFNDTFTSIVSEWSLVCGQQYVSDLISSAQMAGLMLGAGSFGQLSDVLGRKKSYFLAHGTYTLFGFISVFIPWWQGYMACRVLVGVGFGGTMVVNCVYPLEFVGHKWRALTGTIGFWALAEMLLALIAYLLNDWKHLVIATSLSGLIYFITWPIIPESPRWLVQMGRFEEAKEILDTIAEKNGRPKVNLDVLRRFAEFDQKQELALKKYTYIDLFRRWKYIKITLGTILAWFTTLLIYYELSYNLRSLSGNRSLNMFYGGIVDLAAMLIVILFANGLGRKGALLLFLAIAWACSLSLVCMVATDTKESLDWLFTVFALVGKGGALGGTYTCQIFSAELYPTVIRNLGVGVGSISGRLGGILAPQIVFLGTYAELVPYLVPMVLCVLVIPIMLILRETNKKPLEDVYRSQTFLPQCDDVSSKI